MNVLLAPNGKPSNLTPEQYKLVRTPAFKEWFGDWENLIITKLNDSGIDEVSLKRLEDGVSKIIDNNGEPLPVYHGTNTEFYKFDKSKGKGSIKQKSINFSSKKEVSKDYGSKVLECFLNIRNPYIKNYNGESYWTIESNARHEKKFDEIPDQIVNKTFDEKIYDGVVFLNIKDSKSRYSQNVPVGNNYYAFNNKQIKLADGTNTTFDGNNPDIRFDGGGRVSNYKEFYDNLKIEDGSKYIGQKFADLFPFIGKKTSPAQFRISVKEYNNLLGRLENDNYTTKSMKTADFNRLEKRQKYIDKKKYLSRFYLDPSGTIIGFDNSDNTYADGGSFIINPTEIECHTCHWKWKVKDGGDDLFICHKCYTDNSKFYKFEDGALIIKPKERLQWNGYKIGDIIDGSKLDELSGNLVGDDNNKYILVQQDLSIYPYSRQDLIDSDPDYQEEENWRIESMKENFEKTPPIPQEGDGMHRIISAKELGYKTILMWKEYNSNNNFKKGGRTIAQTPAPKKDQIKGSDKNKEGSSKDLTSAKKIELSDSTIEAIKNKVDKHNEKYPKKKITIDSAKAVVRRGMGAYSSSYRPTISGGKPNSRVAWGLARLNAFFYKIINGKSKSGKYNQDDDLINELGYKVKKYADGGQVEKMKNLFLQNGFTEDKLQVIVEENTNYFNQIEFFDNKTLIVYRALELPRKLADKFIKLNKKEIGEGIGEYWTFDKNLQNAIWGDGQYEEETYLIQCKGHLDISDIDWEMMKYAYDDDIYHFSQESEIRGVNGGNSIKVVECEEVYSNGGDIQAYEDAMGISQFDDGGETKPKKVYVSIRLDNESKKIPNTFNEYFSTYSEQPFEELKNGVLKGLVGVSSSPNNIAEWFIHRDCLIVMDYKEFIAINETETINYYDPYQLMKNNLYLFKRLYANVGARSSNKEGSYVFKQTLVKILEKIVREINLEMNLAEGQKYSELYRISRFLSPYETSAFPDWIEENKIKIESPIDLTNAILDFNKLNVNASYLGYGFENSVLTFDELLPVIEKGVTNASSVYDSEQEIVLINRKLNIPKNSQLFFIGKDEIGRIRKSNLDELIENYNLKELYKVYFVDRQQIQKYRDFWVQKEEKKFKQKLEKGREDLELKKEKVLNELLNYFLEKSISYVKNVLEKEILDYYESLDYYDETDVDYVEQSLFSIPLVESIMNTYVLIIKNFWKSFIQKKQVKNLDLYAFDMFYFNVKQELKNYFENKKDELEKLNNYRNTRGGFSLDPYRFERLLLKTIDDYENLPELIDYKELSKMYLDKMGRELYRYYDKKDLPLISQYKDGGETDEPTHFWGTEAGGVLVYCSTTERYLILLRSEWVLEPNTWGVISGKLDDEENVQEAVLREAQEETGHKLGNLIPSFIFEKPNFKFHNFVSIVEEEFTPELDWENSDYRWVKLNEMPENLHFGLKLLLQKEDLPKLVKKNKMENEILIVDINMYRYNTSVNFKNKEIPVKLYPPKNEINFIEWAEENNIEFEQWGDIEMIDGSWGYTFEIPLYKYIEYMKTEKFYTGGELKKGIKTEMEHKNTIKKIKTGDYNIKESAELIAKDHLKENDKYYTHLSKMEKQFSEGGLTDKKEDFNVPTTESLIESVSKEREKYIKNLRKQGFKVVVGRNDGYYWNLESEKDGVSELAKNPSKRKVLEIIKNNPSVTKIGFQGTLLVADKVGEELEIVDDFAVVLWEKDSIFFKEGLNFEFVYDNGKYINVIVNKNDTETYKDRKDDGNYVYFKSIDKKYNTISERRSKIEFLKEEFDNGEAFIVNKMEEGGKVESIHSSKGDIKLSLEENWYSDDTDVELVPVSELIKFREFDRKVSPKYNKENSVDNINHLKFMFQKDGVKSPLIIEYSKEDNAVLIIEGNHRLNSAIDLGMEYLPARVVLKKYSKFSKSQLKNAMKVSGVEGDQYGYIPSNMKPSKVGIQGTMPIYADGGIIEGRLHSECGDDGCGRKFQVGENGHIIEAERDEAVIVADAFNNNEKYTIKGTPSEVASALNVIGGGKNFDKGATIIKNGQELEIPELKKQAIDTDVEDVIDSGSIIINRRSMYDKKKYEVTGTPKQIASAINSINGNGVVIEKGSEIKEN